MAKLVFSRTPLKQISTLYFCLYNLSSIKSKIMYIITEKNKLIIHFQIGRKEQFIFALEQKNQSNQDQMWMIKCKDLRNFCKNKKQENKYY
jgi:hypothetical protein